MKREVWLMRRNNGWYICKMKYNPTIKRNGMLTHTTKLNLKDILNAYNLTKKVLTYHVIPLL